MTAGELCERRLVGSVICDPTQVPAVIEHLQGTDLIDTGLRRIFETVCQLKANEKEVSLLTVNEALRESGHLDEAGGPAFLSELVSDLPNGNCAAAYAYRLRELRVQPEITGEFEQGQLDLELEKLAGLSSVQYDQHRKAAAKDLKIRIKTLDTEVAKLRASVEGNEGSGSEVPFPEVEPWTEPVDGSQLLDDLRREFGRFLVLPDHSDIAMALWVVFAHAHDASQISPLLAFLSPEKRCGKTTALALLQRVVPRPLPAANITSAALFRATERWKPCLLVDEADSFLRDNEELRGCLNSGHNRSTANVIRTVGENHEPKVFRTWAPTKQSFT